MIIRVNEVGVDASLLQCDIDLALDLLFLCLLDSHAKLLVDSSLRNRCLVESDRLHSSHLHGYLVACILVGSGELNHGAQCVATHVVVGVDVLALKHVVAVELHLLTDNARATCHSLGNLQTISQCQLLHLIEGLSLSSDGSVEDVLCQLDIVSTVGHEVGLALQCDHGSEAIDVLHQHAAVGCGTVRTLCSDSQTTLANELYGLVNITISLGQSLLAVFHACTGHSAELLDVFNCNSHNGYKSIGL